MATDNSNSIYVVPRPAAQDGPLLASPSNSSMEGPSNGAAGMPSLATQQFLQTIGAYPPSPDDPSQLLGSGADLPDGTYTPPPVEKYLSEYDKLNPLDPALQQSVDVLQARYGAAVDPAQKSYAGLLKQGPPEFQAPRPSPWLVALGAGLGALQNAVEPYHQTGVSSWLAAPLDQAYQSAQDDYSRAREAYASRLDNAQAQYGLAKDAGQTYLDQAQQIQDELRDHAAGRLQFAAQSILQDQNATANQKAEQLRQLFETERDRQQRDWQSDQAARSRRQDLHMGVVNALARQGDLAGLSRLLQSDYLEGKPVDDAGNPLDPNDATAVQMIHQSAMSGTPSDLAAVLGQRVAQQTAEQGRIHQQAARRQMRNLMRVIGSAYGRLLNAPPFGG